MLNSKLMCSRCHFFGSFEYWPARIVRSGAKALRFPTEQLGCGSFGGENMGTSEGLNQGQNRLVLAKIPAGRCPLGAVSV